MIINRDYTRTEGDDFALNVVSRLGERNEVVPVYQKVVPVYQKNEERELVLVGWKVVMRYE